MDELIQRYLSSASPRDAWRNSLVDRHIDWKGGGENQDELANVEHYLWANQFGQKSPLHGLMGMYMPAGYGLAKKAGLLGGRTKPSMGQWGAGTMGAFNGLLGSGIGNMVPGVGPAMQMWK